MRMWVTNQDTTKYELSKEETKKLKEFRVKVNKVRASQYKLKKVADIDIDYSITVSFVEGHIGSTVYVECPGLNLKENITDYSVW